MILESLVKTYGYWALVIGTFLEGETILIIGGVVARMGYLELPLVMLSAFIGSFAGDQIYFFIGRFKGINMLAKYIKWQRHIDNVNSLLEKYHDLIMLGFRFIYGMRIITPFVLGMNRNIKTGRFILLNAIGAGIWSVIISGGGYLFGYALQAVIKDIKQYEITVIGGISIIGTAVWFIHRLRKNKTGKTY